MWFGLAAVLVTLSGCGDGTRSGVRACESARELMEECGEGKGYSGECSDIAEIKYEDSKQQAFDFWECMDDSLKDEGCGHFADIEGACNLAAYDY